MVTIGEACERAHRLCEVARPNTIVVDDETLQAGRERWPEMPEAASWAYDARARAVYMLTGPAP